MRYAIIAGLSVIIIALDQITKMLATTNLAPVGEVVVSRFFSLVYVLNRGAAFGFLNDPTITWQFWLFAAATIIALGVIYFLAKTTHAKDYVQFIALGCISGGAIGNFIDRIRFRAVVDFLDFHIGDLHWPAFNVADIAICIGGLLIAYILLFPSKHTNEGKND